MLGEKLALIEGREIGGWHDWPRYRDAISQDIIALRRPAATITGPFEMWRAAYKRFVLAAEPGQEDDPAADRAMDEAGEARSAALLALFAAPCASPGDFMLKAYADALECLGHTSHGAAKDDGTGSLWDINIAMVDHVTLDHDHWQRSAYHDLDHSDLGACLLAFGQLDFTADAWLRRAHALSIPIGLHVTGDEQTDLQIGLYHGDTCARRQRERQRLERLLAFDPARMRAVADAILHEWRRATAPACVPRLR